MNLTSFETHGEAVECFLTDHREDQVRFLADLVRTPSDNPPGHCAPHALRAAELLEKLGLVVERHPVPEAECRRVGMTSAVNLVVRERWGIAPVLALNAHGDVVPPGAGWTTDPYGAETRKGWMYGRGVAVSKSDFATYAYTLLALKHARVPLRGSVELHFTYDEEMGGEIGPRRLLQTGVSRPDFAICAGFSYGVVTAHNGCLHLEVTVEGRSAHAARPATGIDALEGTTRILSALYRHRASLAAVRSAVPGIGSPALVVGLISGGINTNVVPDRVTFRLDRRVIPEEDIYVVERELRDQIERAAHEIAGLRCAIRPVLRAEPMVRLPGADRLAQTIAARAGRILGEPIPLHGVPLYTDARHYASAGVPTVIYGAGPRTIEEANAHRADERLALDDLMKATRVMALSVMDLLRSS